MVSLERNIKELIQFYVKENYNEHLKDNNIQYIKEDDIEAVVCKIYTERKDHLKQFVKESLKTLMEECPSELIINNILLDVFRDDDFCINRIVLEIKLFQAKKMKGEINKSETLR
tara:strand:- start:263 stop:607 length:345 start_codon:yes stop_codon:yes gene_type:complete